MTQTIAAKKVPGSSGEGARLHRFTVAEYEAMAERGILPEDDPVELVEGLLCIKSDIVPPYGVPVGIPPKQIWPDADGWIAHPLRRLSADQYARMVSANILDAGMRHELIEGWVVEKMSRNPPHELVLSLLQDLLGAALPKEWCLRIQLSLALDESTPEPDIAIVAQPRTQFRKRHPTPTEVELIVEVADATLSLDLGPKRRSYARNGIRCLWVVDIPNEILHVFTRPSGPVDEPFFAKHQMLKRKERVELRIKDERIAELKVAEIFG